MKDLDTPDLHYLSAALGWHELGNPVEAAAEWDRLSPEAQLHPHALEVRWLILASVKDWDQGVEIAERMVKHAPHLCSGWLHRAYSLRRCSQGGLQRAWDALHPAAERFPDEFLVAYNLACYAAQLGRLDEGWEWFLRSLQICADPSRVKRMALDDTDLEPLWHRIRGLRGIGS